RTHCAGIRAVRGQRVARINDAGSYPCSRNVCRDCDRSGIETVVTDKFGGNKPEELVLDRRTAQREPRVLDHGITHLPDATERKLPGVRRGRVAAEGICGTVNGVRS